MASVTLNVVMTKTANISNRSIVCGLFLNNFRSETKRKHHSRRPWRVMFFGSDDFSMGSLPKLYEEWKCGDTVSKLEVVSSKWHLNPVRRFSLSKGLVVHAWPIEPRTVSDFDVGLVVSFGHLIPKKIIDAFPLGIINVHGSLLPKWRGAAPVNYAIMHGESVTGISMMRIRPHKFDEGEVISQREVPIFPSETAPQLRNRLSEIGAEELISCIRRLPQCLSEARQQSEDGVCYAPKITPNLGVLDFETMTAQCIYNRYRALVGLVPLTTIWMGQKISLLDVSTRSICPATLSHLVGFPNTARSKLSSSAADCDCLVLGQVLVDKKFKQIIVKCQGDDFLVVNCVAPPLKKPISALDFYNGYLSKQSKVHWVFRNK